MIPCAKSMKAKVASQLMAQFRTPQSSWVNILEIERSPFTSQIPPPNLGTSFLDFSTSLQDALTCHKLVKSLMEFLVHVVIPPYMLLQVISWSKVSHDFCIPLSNSPLHPLTHHRIFYASHNVRCLHLLHNILIRLI